MASIAAGRRTQSSYPTFLASAHPSDLNVTVYAPGGGAVTPLTAALSHLPGVKKVRSVGAPAIVPLTRSGAPRLSTTGDVTALGSLDGEFLEQDRPAIVEGRRSDPNRADEIVMTATAARLLGVHVGEAVPVGFYTSTQESLPGFGTPSVAPRIRLVAKLVGIMVLDNAVVQDDIDRAYGFVLLTPALIQEAKSVSPASASPLAYGLKLDQGSSVKVVEQEIIHLSPPGSTVQFHATAPVVTEVELAIRPESVALCGFGVIAVLVCLILGIQAINRQLRLGDDDRQVMRAIGAGPVAAAADGLMGILGSVLVGSVLAAAVAVALSPLAPLGPVRPFYPDPGVSFDWTVLGAGLAVLVTVLCGAGVCCLIEQHRIAWLGSKKSRHVPRALSAAPRRRGCRSLACSECASPSSRAEAEMLFQCAPRSAAQS